MNRTFEYQQIDTFERSILEWVESFGLDNLPESFSSLYNGVALYEVLNKVDFTYWPMSKITTTPQTIKQSVINFKTLIQGMEKYYQQKLDSLIQNQTSLIDVDRLVQHKDQSCLYDILELVMGVIINSEEKQTYIERILELDEKTQEDLQKLIEKSLQRLSVEFSEASQISDSTAHQEMQQQVERVERERKLLREKV